MMTSSEQDHSMPPPPPKSSKKDDNKEEEIVNDNNNNDKVLLEEEEEVVEGEIVVLRDPKTGEVDEEGQIAVLRDPKTGEPVPEESTKENDNDADLKTSSVTTVDSGSVIEKEDIVDVEDDEKENTKDKKADTIAYDVFMTTSYSDSEISSKSLSFGEEEDETVTKTSISNVASGRPSRRSKIEAEQKMAAAVKNEESDDDNDFDDDFDDDKTKKDYNEEAEQKAEDGKDDNDEEEKVDEEAKQKAEDGKDDNDEEEKGDDAVVKKESEGNDGDDGDMADDDDKSTKRKSKNKKRKKTKAKDSIKSENADVKKEEEEEDWEPVEEKPKERVRVSELVVEHAAGEMFTQLVKNHKDGIAETPLDILAASITSKSGKPYKNHRSDAIQEGMKLLKAQGKAEKTGGNKNSVARLLQSEIDKIPKEKISKDPNQVVKQRKAQFLLSLENHPKGGSGEKVTDAATDVWNKLLDGEEYTRKELVADTTYAGTNSTGFEAIMKVLIQLKFVEGKGKCSFSDKIFPHGRPNKVTN